MNPPRNHNRISEILEQINWYLFSGQSRLARDAGISRSVLNRLVRGQTMPSFKAIVKITAALEKRLGKRIDPREIVSLTGDDYPTASVKDLCSKPASTPRQ